MIQLSKHMFLMPRIFIFLISRVLSGCRSSHRPPVRVDLFNVLCFDFHLGGKIADDGERRSLEMLQMSTIHDLVKTLTRKVDAVANKVNGSKKYIFSIVAPCNQVFNNSCPNLPFSINQYHL